MSAGRLVIGAVASALLMSAGCRERGTPGSAPRGAPKAAPTAIGGGPPPTELAIDQLGEARCDKEARCGRIGPDGSYDTRHQCLDADLMSRFDALDPANCPSGIDTKRLAACIEALRSERCDSDALTSGCTLQALCAR